MLQTVHTDGSKVPECMKIMVPIFQYSWHWWKYFLFMCSSWSSSYLNGTPTMQERGCFQYIFCTHPMVLYKVTNKRILGPAGGILHPDLAAFFKIVCLYGVIYIPLLLLRAAMFMSPLIWGRDAIPTEDEMSNMCVGLYWDSIALRCLCYLS